MRPGAVALLLLVPALAGCSVIPESQAKEVSGAVDGYDPAASHLKVHLRTADDRIVLVDFDRRDWNVMGIAQAIDNKTVRALTIQGMPREILNEILVETVGDPTSLAKYRWADSAYTPEERSAFEKAYDDLVAKGAPVAPSVELPVTPSAPSLAIPST